MLKKNVKILKCCDCLFRDVLLLTGGHGAGGGAGWRKGQQRRNSQSNSVTFMLLLFATVSNVTSL